MSIIVLKKAITRSKLIKWIKYNKQRTILFSQGLVYRIESPGSNQIIPIEIAQKHL